MKVFVILSVVVLASASLEPAGYRPPGSSPSTRYLPANRNVAIPSNQYLPAHVASPNNQYLPAHVASPNKQYLPPSSSQYSSPSSQYLSPSSQYSGPSSQYSTPSSQYSSPSKIYLPASASASQQYSAPSHSSGPSQSSFSSAPVNHYSSPSNRYLPAQTQRYSQSGYQYGSAEDSAPAKYDFEYQVNDEYGNDFGHKESRDGDNTQGVYTVLLPDGRKQIVHYEADQDGYKPRITYEESKQAYNGYTRQGSHGGYPQAGPY
ncbi:pro-resilin isoform X2 [Cephus cinctus]|uniref:Pro-resilin isoform X2 n=1 Tax=Cephus cinctus TaxID=211228 RepID=A0AAJ7FNP2_CEPCN|nr:pro-resilin isoform X2 [Cephus cinctus]